MIISAPVTYNKTNPGHLDIFLRNLDEKRYYINAARQGYFRPFASEWKTLDYRVKKEVIPYMLRDCGAIILNPEHNKVSLWQIITGKPKYEKGVVNVNSTTTGRGLMIVQWCFKWFNILRINRLFGIYPVSIASRDDKDIPYDNLQEVWTYCFVFGQFKDMINELGEEVL